MAKRHEVSPLKHYTFNHELGIDVVEIEDASDTHYNLLNVVCHGTTFQQAYVVRVADIHGVPSSSSYLNSFTELKAQGRFGPSPFHHHGGPFGADF